MRRFLAIVVVFAGALDLAQSQTGVGSKYGSRDPFVCKSRKEPAKGTPMPAQIKDYVKCSSENVVGRMAPKLYLLEHVPVEVGKGRPFQAADLNFAVIDNSMPLYPIRGSYDWYICHVNEAGFPAGRNCSIYKEPNASGFCYKTTFGDWNCTMADRAAIARGPEAQPVAPPK